ncbi:aldo/keto reductase [Arthrobacter sp. D1-29]
MTEQPPYSILARGVEREVLPLAQRHRPGVLPCSPSRQPERHDPSSAENARKTQAVLELTELAEQAGLSLIHLALGFVLEHPAVTSAIIGPRTLEQLEGALGADKVGRSKDVLDRIAEIVPPGTTLNQADAGYRPPSLTDPLLRRRSRRTWRRWAGRRGKLPPSSALLAEPGNCRLL